MTDKVQSWMRSTQIRRASVATEHLLQRLLTHTEEQTSLLPGKQLQLSSYCYNVCFSGTIFTRNCERDSESSTGEAGVRLTFVFVEKSVLAPTLQLRCR